MKIANKKAIELSLNFIVIFVITVTIFGFGIKFISDLSAQANQVQYLTISDLDDKIGDIICEGSERVCVGIDRKTIKRTKFGIFGIKIINILDSQNFDIEVTRPNPSGYTVKKTPILADDLIWNPKLRSVYIEKNDEKIVGIGIQVPADAVPGTYIFDVTIRMQDANPYTPVKKLYVDVRE